MDGGQHAAAIDHDAARTTSLERLGFKVLRFWNTEVLQQTDAVMEVIASEVTTLCQRGEPREPSARAQRQ